MKRVLGGLVGLVALAWAGIASAAVVTATNVEDANLGTFDPAYTGAARYTSSNVVGPKDNQFYSLGLGGDITVSFGTTITGSSEIRLSEVTFGNIPTYGESVDVFAIFNGSTTFVGSLTNLQAEMGTVLTYGGSFQQLKFVDTTGTVFPTSPSNDGFDIDSIEVSFVSAIPLPASGAALLGALGAIAMVVRRRRS